MTAANRLRVLIIDPDRRVRSGLSDLLTTETDLEICATAGSPRTALAHISAQRPDVALLDVLLPGPAQGLGLLQKLHTLGLPVVVLTTATSLRDQAQQSGAAAFRQPPPHPPSPASSRPGEPKNPAPALIWLICVPFPA